MATFLTGTPTTAPQGPYVVGQTTDNGLMLGAKFNDQSGKTYCWSLVGATALVPGKLYQAPVEITAHQDLTPVAAAIGSTQVTVALGATAATANQYSQGYLYVTVTPGQGYRYRISANPAAALSTSMIVTLEDPLLVALTTSSRVDLVLNEYSGVIVNPSTATSCPVGAAIYPVAAASYGWLQVGGVASLLADGTVTVGTTVVASNATAGAVEAFTGVQAVVGIAQSGIATTEYGPIKLLLG